MSFYTAYSWLFHLLDLKYCSAVDGLKQRYGSFNIQFTAVSWELCWQGGVEYMLTQLLFAFSYVKKSF